MSAIDFYVFCFVAFFCSIAGIRSSKTLYAVVWQLQTVTAVCGLMACQNARFAAFALMSTASSIFLTLLMFSMIVFASPACSSGSRKERSWLFFAAVVLPASEFGWLYFHLPHQETLLYAAGFSLASLGTILYTRYAICLIVSALVLTGAMAGVTMLMMNKKGDNSNRSDILPIQEAKTELRRIPVERKYL